MLCILFAEKDIGDISNDGLFPAAGLPALDAPCHIRSNVRMMMFFLYCLVLYHMQTSRVRRNRRAVLSF